MTQVLDLAAVGAQLRPWRKDDAASLVRHANNRNVWINLRDTFPHPYTPEDARQWLERVTALRPATHFAIVLGGEAVGGIGFEPQSDVLRRSAEVGFWLGEPFWGRGITTAALVALSEHAFAAADLVRLYAYVFEWNAGSMRVLEKAGYVREACLRHAVVKDGKIIDQYVYALVKE